MSYRIGIDLGTNSLGWAAIQLLEPKPGTFEAGQLLDLGVRIFQMHVILRISPLTRRSGGGRAGCGGIGIAG